LAIVKTQCMQCWRSLTRQETRDRTCSTPRFPKPGLPRLLHVHGFQLRGRLPGRLKVGHAEAHVVERAHVVGPSLGKGGSLAGVGVGEVGDHADRAIVGACGNIQELSRLFPVLFSFRRGVCDRVRAGERKFQKRPASVCIRRQLNGRIFGFTMGQHDYIILSHGEARILIGAYTK